MQFTQIGKRGILALCAAGMLLLAACSPNTTQSGESSTPSQGESTTSQGTVVDRPAPLTDADFLSVEESRLVNRNGETVRLRGVNLGGWLIQENWMCPIEGADGEWANLDTIEILESRGFTDEQIQTLFNTYQENWITEYDLDIIAGTSCNVVRVPFWYRNFMLDTEGTWISENLDENPGFQRLDWLIEECGERGIYVILDMHGAPGGQSLNHCCGTLGENRLYTDETCQQTMETLWRTIAARYKGNPTVAAYDVMNEPQNNGGFEEHPKYMDSWDPATWATYNAVYARMVAAIREVDPDHVISLEGIWRVENLPDPADYGWTNMLYQVHLYDETDAFRNIARQTLRTVSKWKVAGYVGEFSNVDGIAICEELGLNWTTWSYKGGTGDWGNWFWIWGRPRAVDPANDTYEEILEKWGEPLRSEGTFFLNTELLEAIEEGIAGG